jgi:hypothetical protein
MKTVRLTDIAAVIRSKNAGPFELTLDILFNHEMYYRHAKEIDFFNAKLISRLYGISIDNITGIIYFDPAAAVKITLVRPVASGSIGDTDVYGAQQHVPLLSLEVPVGDLMETRPPCHSF